MPSFFSRAATYLNQTTNHLVDWSRIGNLVFSNHHYSAKEILERSFIITCSAAGGFLAWNKSEQGGATTFVLGASVAFTLAHTVIISPLIYKRLNAMWGCQALIKTIHTQLSQNQTEELSPLVVQVIEKITKHESEKNTSAVWGKRQRLLKTLSAWISDAEPNHLRNALKDNQIIAILDRNTLPDLEAPMLQ